MIEKDNWNDANALNQADGNKASSYLEDLINENIEEKITDEQILENLKEHYTDERDN